MSTTANKVLRIGAGAGFAGDRIEPAIALAEHAQLDFLVFECLAERTMALAQLRKQRGDSGYDPLLEVRMRAVLAACHRNGVRIITNMGAADPCAAMHKTIEIARELGLRGLRVACVEGDDVMHHLQQLVPFDEEPLPQEHIISANAYLGADALLEALNEDADVIITGRVADPSMFVAPILHAFEWNRRDWNLVGAATAVGHLLECAGQLTGGYFADPPYKVVPNLEDLGFPYAQIAATGSATLHKLSGTGGVLNLQTCREQLLYEVMDPARYITPDVTADFTKIALSESDQDTVCVEGGTGTSQPEKYKVSVGLANGYFGDAQISYAGQGARGRAELAQSILSKRMRAAGYPNTRYELIGLNSLHGDASRASEPYEVRLRAVDQFPTAAEAALIAHEAESLYVNGPAGGAGVTSAVRESVAIHAALIAREAVAVSTRVEVA